MIDRAYVMEQLVRSIQHRSQAQDAHLKVLGMGDLFTRHLINNLCRRDHTYGEIGGLIGASAIAAASNHRAPVWMVEDFSYWQEVPDEDDPREKLLGQDWCQVRGRPLREACRTQIERCGMAEQIRVYEADATVFVPPDPVDVLYYDGNHSCWVTEQCLRRYVCVGQPSVLLVDDFLSESVQAGVEGADLAVTESWFIPTHTGLWVGWWHG